MDLLVILSAFMSLGGVILHHNAKVWFDLSSAFWLNFYHCKQLKQIKEYLFQPGAVSIHVFDNTVHSIFANREIIAEISDLPGNSAYTIY